MVVRWRKTQRPRRPADAPGYRRGGYRHSERDRRAGGHDAVFGESRPMVSGPAVGDLLRIDDAIAEIERKLKRFDDSARQNWQADRAMSLRCGQSWSDCARCATDIELAARKEVAASRPALVGAAPRAMGGYSLRAPGRSAPSGPKAVHPPARHSPAAGRRGVARGRGTPPRVNARIWRALTVQAGGDG